MKPCTSCGREFSEDNFYAVKRKGVFERFMSICKECAKAKQKRYREANPEKARDSKNRSVAKRKDYYLKKAYEWRDANRERYLENQRRYTREVRVYDKNKCLQWVHKRRDRMRGVVNPAEWRALVEQYDGKCLCCGRDDLKMTMDHVIPIIKGGPHLISNIQPLCMPCNRRKGQQVVDYRPA
jgi:5-methylcytosine-specific restriction endonuclease McrA